MLESVYEWCLTKELEVRDHSTESPQHVTVRYKQFQRDYPLRFDLLIDGCLFVELKATGAVHSIHQAQRLSHMKLLDIPLGLIINFNVLKLTDGVSRLILPGANKSWRHEPEVAVQDLRFLRCLLFKHSRSQSTPKQAGSRP